MSRLSPDVIDVALAPAGMLLSRHNRLTRRQRLRAQQHFPSALTLNEALEQLQSALQLQEWSGAGGLRLVLSNHWLRFAVLPWSDSLTRPAERRALALNVMEEIYGDCGTQEIRISEAGFRRPALAAALPSYALQQLQLLSQEHALPLLSLQPLLMQAFAACRKQIKGGDHAFACLEPGKLTLLTSSNHRWQSVQSRSLPYQDHPPVAPMLTQLFAQLDQLPPQTLLIGCGQQVTLQTVAGVPVINAATELGWPTPGAWE